jgi:hypothetical protein
MVNINHSGFQPKMIDDSDGDGGFSRARRARNGSESAELTVRDYLGHCDGTAGETLGHARKRCHE